MWLIFACRWHSGKEEKKCGKKLNAPADADSVPVGFLKQESRTGSSLGQVQLFVVYELTASSSAKLGSNFAFAMLI